jgi:GNAT superfamily N-acetyltransferase
MTEGDRMSVRKILQYALSGPPRMKWPIRKVVIYERSLNDNIPTVEPKRNVDVGIATSGDIKQLTMIIGKKTLQRRLKGKDICFVAKEGKRIVGYTWVVFQSLYVDETNNELKSDKQEPWSYDSFVFPKYRNQKIFQKMLEQVLLFLKGKKFKRIYGHIFYDNMPSRTSVEKMGFKIVKILFRLKLFKFGVLIDEAKLIPSYRYRF